jgi:DNA helicase-2/ATP-dependent DNA helicase PcrA
MIQIWLLDLLKNAGACVHIIGDLDQSIYEFRLVNPNDTQNYILSNKYLEMKLTQNYRSCQEIVDVTAQIINRKLKVVGMQEQKCCEPLRVIFYERGKEHIAVEKYKEILDREHLKETNSYIIVRNNTLKKKITGDKSSRENALEGMAKAIHYYRKYTSLNDYIEMFNHAGKAISRIFFKEYPSGNSGNFYCPGDFRADEWRILIYHLLQSLSTNKNLDFTITWNEWKKALAKEFAILQNEYSILNECKCELGRIRNNKGGLPVSDLFVDTSVHKNKFNITTIHGAKGMSLDSVLVFSSYQKTKNESGAFWKMWFETKEISEKNRLAYVSFSRAKHLLVLAIPRTKKDLNSDFNDLFYYGFVEFK